MSTSRLPDPSPPAAHRPRPATGEHHPDYCDPEQCHRDGPDVVHCSTPRPMTATRDGEPVAVTVTIERHDDLATGRREETVVLDAGQGRVRIDAAALTAIVCAPTLRASA